MIKIDVPLSDGWWLNRLAMKLNAKLPRYAELERYYKGKNGLPVGTADRRVVQAYEKLKSLANINFGELVVEAVRERMDPIGFMTGEAEDITGDSEAWRIWQANGLDARSAVLFRQMLYMAEAYVIVNGEDARINAPLITIEDPREVIVDFDPQYHRRVVAAAKFFRDDLNEQFRAYLYLPGRVRIASKPFNQTLLMEDQTYKPLTDISSWTFDADEQTFTDPEIIPVVPFYNQMDTANCSKGEFESHTALLDRINYEVFNRLEIATMQAFKQRAMKNLPTTDEDGNIIDYTGIFQASAGAVWQLPEGVDIWESGQVDLTGILQAVKDDIINLAAVTRTPLFYLTADAANGSAEGASLAREGLVFKCKDRLKQTGEALEEVMSIAFRLIGDETRADRESMSVIWASPEQFSLAEKLDAATKAQSIGMPFTEICKLILQLTPQEIDRIEQERASERLANAGIANSIQGSAANVKLPTATPNPGSAPVPAQVVSNGAQ